MTPEQRRARASIAARTRFRAPDDLDLERDRAAMKAARLRSTIAEAVGTGPALSVDQRAELAELLRGTGAAA